MFDNHERPSRSLPFPLRHPETFSIVSGEGDITHLTPDIFPLDNDEKINIVLNLSLNEFVAIASSIDVGSDIAYGDNRNLVWWTWVRSFIGLAANMTCEQVADCIESEIDAGNTTLINKLTENNINTGTGGNYNRVNGDITTVLDRNPPLSLQSDVKELPNCDLNALWGGIRHGIVERLDDTARDLLEDLAAINDTPQRFQAFIDVIPVLGDIAEGIVTLATEVIPDILNLYNSYSSEAILDEIACDLFALVCSECRYPTFEELYNYYSTLGYDFSSMEAQTLAPMVQKIAAMIGTFQPSSIVYHSMITFQLFTLYLQAQWNGNAGTSTILKFAALGEDFGSNNWLDLCETCNEQYVLWTWDFTTQGQGEFYADLANTTSKAVFESGKGWRAVPHSGGKRFNVNMLFDPSWEVRAAAMKFSGTGGTDRTWYRRPTWASTTGQQNASAGFSNAEWQGAWEGYGSVTGYNEAGFYASTTLANDLWLEKVSILFNVGKSPSGNAVSTNDLTPYSTP